MVNVAYLRAQEWRHAAFLQCGIEPPDLIFHYGGCRVIFSTMHALYCKKGGLVTSRHNKLCYGVANLSRKSFTPTHMCDNLLINAGCTVKSGKALKDKSNPLNNPPGLAVES